MRPRRLAAVLTSTAMLAAACNGAADPPPPPDPTAAAVASSQIRPELTPINGSSGAMAGSAVRLALRVVLPETHHMQSDRPSDPSYIATQLWLDTPEGITFSEVAFPPAIDFSLEGIPEPLEVLPPVFVAGVTLQIASDVPPGPVRLPGLFRYQACDDTTCFSPRTIATGWTIDVVPPGTAVEPAREDVFREIDFARGYPPPTDPPPPPRPDRTVPGGVAMVGPTEGGTPARSDPFAKLDDFTLISAPGGGGYMGAADFVRFIDDAENGRASGGLLENQGVWAILGIALVGGLLLNLTPCVLPMIPINLAIIGAGSQAGSRRRGFMLGATYGAAMAVVYGVLGLVVIMTAGTFGAINSSPWFNVAIVFVFVLLALAMFDVINIDFSGLGSRIRFGEQSRGTFYLAFGMGAVAALLAGACVAPVVIQVILFSSDLYAGGSTAALALPFMLGLGMALPWPVAGAGLSALPKPGAWMVRVKQAFGIFILGMAAYYGWIAWGLFANRWVDPAEVRASVEAKLEEGWYADLDEGLAVARREGKLVLIDLWATWCKNCVVMDETTLVDPAVQARLADYVKVKHQAEFPDDPPDNLLMKRIGAIGLPAYGIFRPKAMAASDTERQF
jgi:cytochrome c biogenesis protein CcdA